LKARFVLCQRELQICLCHTSFLNCRGCRSQLSKVVPASAATARAAASVAIAVSWMPVPVRSATVI
jgi:hypothetical protein